MTPHYQTTLRIPVVFSGLGVHSGKPVRLVVHPASAGHGVMFLRTGLDNGYERLIEAKHIAVSASDLCTMIGEEDSGAVSTIEHLMAALAGLGIDNVLVEIDGPEVPILDGSAEPFVDGFMNAGFVELAAPRRYLKVLKPVRVASGKAFAELRPFERGFRLDVEIDFNSAVIGRQRRIIDLDPVAFQRDIARARTFGFMRDVEKLWKAGFALGASLENTVAIGDDAVVNPEGLRYPDEFVRHKLLDAVGDLALAGLPLLGQFRSYCGGHRLNVGIVEALLADRSNYTVIETAPRRDTRVRALGHADMGALTPAYAANGR